MTRRCHLPGSQISDIDLEVVDQVLDRDTGEIDQVYWQQRLLVVLPSRPRRDAPLLVERPVDHAEAGIDFLRSKIALGTELRTKRQRESIVDQGLGRV